MLLGRLCDGVFSAYMIMPLHSNKKKIHCLLFVHGSIDHSKCFFIKPLPGHEQKAFENHMVIFVRSSVPQASLRPNYADIVSYLSSVFSWSRISSHSL